jgi:peptidylprolyl isomerase
MSDRVLQSRPDLILTLPIVPAFRGIVGFDPDRYNTYPRGVGSMRMSQVGDRVQAHYTKRFTDGSARSSRLQGEQPLELIVGSPHPRLPGIASGLVGLEVGQKVTLHVPANEAYGMPDPQRISQVDRARFTADEKLEVGKRASMQLGRGRTRRVTILEIHERKVVVDTNHPRCGQSLELDVELVAILTPAQEVEHSGS